MNQSNMNIILNYEIFGLEFVLHFCFKITTFSKLVDFIAIIHFESDLQKN
jgi:hypothetical protein